MIYVENSIFCVKPFKKVLGKSRIYDMTLMSGALDKSVFDGNNFLLRKGEENYKHRFLKIGGDMVCSSLTDDSIYKYISNMGTNLTPSSIAVGHENIYFLTPHFIFIKREKINDNELLKTKTSSVDPFDYHVSNCEKYLFKKLRKYKIN